MKKYIIKNCPAKDTRADGQYCKENNGKCENCNSCLLKRIVNTTVELMQEPQTDGIQIGQASGGLTVFQKFNIETADGQLVFDVSKLKDEDIVKVTCYGRTEELPRAKAIAKYHDCIFCSEGAEQSRYIEIYGQLLNGDKHATDEPYKVIRF